MNSEAFENLNLFDKLHDSNILLKNTSGKSMDAKGKVTIEFEINKKHYTHTFIICESLKRQIVIGCNFIIRNRMTIGWDDDENRNSVC